jgi:hypothetical protein
MKLTKSYLKQLILEELREVEQQQTQQEPEAAPDQKTDVQRVLQYIAKIDNKVEYKQLLNGILKHAQQVNGAKLVVMDAYRETIPALVKTLK